MMTLAHAESTYGVTHLDHLDRQAALPVVDGIAFQGDVAVIRDDTNASSTPIPKAGYPVVRGENGGNTHAVFGPGCYTPATRGAGSDLALGTLTVPAGAQVLLTHPEHGGMLINPGSYVIRRQREMREQIELVQD